MTDVANRPDDRRPAGPAQVPAHDEVTLTVDGIEVTAAKGELVIRVAERMGIAIPRFCDHPLLAPAGACRQCLVEVEGQRKPVASCTQPVADGMVVKTQLTSEVAAKAQEGIMEFLLINHPLDCPMCDKGGECPLQNQAMSSGRTDTRFHDIKRTYEKPIAISSQVLLDRERCVLCQRCTRFSEEIAGDQFIDLMDRSAAEQINIFPGDPFQSYFSGNTVQICPVGALTGAQYRFRSRPFDLVSTPSACEHCAAGCDMRTDWRRGKVLRRLAGDDPEVNEEWNCDKGRWGFQYATATERITTPLVRDANSGDLREASWPEALSVAAQGLREAKATQGVGVLTGGRLTAEDAYAYAKFARVVLGTNDIDFRARPLSTEEAEFLASNVVGVREVGYADIEAAPAVVIVGLEPEEECPILFLRLRKAYRKRKLPVYAVAPYATHGLIKIGATVRQVVPGGEAALLAEDAALRTALGIEGAVLIVGERLATVPGGLSAAAALAAETGAKLAWVPRRAGDRGALETGCLPNLLPGGRAVWDPGARAELVGAWGLEAGVLPSWPGKDTDQMLVAADRRPALRARGCWGRPSGLDRCEVGGARPGQRRLPGELRAAAQCRHAPGGRGLPGRSGGGEGRYLPELGRPAAHLRAGAQYHRDQRRPGAGRAGPGAGVELNTADPAAVRDELAALPATGGVRPAAPAVPASAPPGPGEGEAVLATWHHLLDLGTLTEGDEYLGGTARAAVARISKATAADLGVTDGDPVTVGTDRGAITLPAALTELPDGVVWLPTNSPGATVRRTLGVPAGAIVKITAAAQREAASGSGGVL